MIKKAIELSSLCDQYIYVTIFDKSKQRLVEFTSHKEFTCKVVSNLARSGPESKICHERYTNEDYYLFNKNTTQEKPEKPRKRETKSPRRQSENIKAFEDLVKECEEQSEEPID